FVFESACRTAHILADTVALGLIWAMDRPLVPSLARDIVEEINEAFRKLTRLGNIMGAVARFDGDRNPVDQLKLGKLLIGYRYTFVPPLEALGLEQEISDEFFADFAALVAGA
ncbi:MAG TPA: phage tail sheath C-terminal domain-containing protein, partial [Sphingomonas sp.]